MNLNLYKNVSISDFILSLFISVFLGLGIVWAIFSILGQTLSNTINIEITTLILTSLWLIVVIIKLKRDKIKITDLIGKPQKNSYLLEVPFTFIITFMCYTGIFLFICFALYKANPNIVNQISSTTEVDSNPLFIKIITFVHLVILAPIGEELAIRGIILNRFYNKYGLNKSILYTSLIFAAIHCDKAFFVFPLGLSCSILVYKYKSIVPSILLHILNNLFVSIAMIIPSEDSTQPIVGNLNMSVLMGVLVISILLIAIYSFYIYKNYPRKMLVESYATESYH